MGRIYDTVSVVAIFAVALGLRVYQLNSIPRGILHDEAYNGLDAERILAGARPIFLVANNGREALFIYLQAIAVGLFGPSDFALRSVSAGLGFLTVPATYYLMRRLFSRRVAMLATAWLALSLWHVIFSRVGLRAISLPLVECAAFYGFWRALSLDSGTKPAEVSNYDGSSPKTRVGWAVLAGAMVGVSLYTYTSARFVPFVLIGFVAYLAASCPSRRRTALVALVLSGAVALLVFAPEAWFFVHHLDAFVNRASETSIFSPGFYHGDLKGALIKALRLNLGMFSFVGDDHWDRNIALRPVFDPASSVLFLFGLVLTLRGWRRPANALVVIWFLIMLAPGVVAPLNAPDYLRVVGIIPAIFVFPALGADWLLETLQRSLPRGRESVTSIVLALGFLTGCYFTCDAFFVTWARSAGVAAQFNSDLWEATTQGLMTAQRAAGPVFVGAGDANLPSLAYRFHYGAPRFLYLFDPARSLVFPPSGRAAYYFSDRQRPSPVALAYLDSHVETVTPLPSGSLVLRYQLDSPPDFSPTTPLPARFGDSVEVLGFDLPNDVQAGQTLTVRWYWRIQNTDSRDLTFTNQVFDNANHRLGILDDRAFAPGYWPPGTEGVSSFEVPIAPAATTGPVWLNAAIYDRATMTHLPISDRQGHPAGDALKLGPIKVHGKTPPAPAISHPLFAHFADGIDLIGYDVTSSHDSAQLTLYWSARTRPTQNYTVFVHALGLDGTLIAQADSPPRNGKYPTAVWDSGDVVVDPHGIRIDPAKVSSYVIGLYLPETGRRLPLAGSPADGDSVTVPNDR